MKTFIVGLATLLLTASPASADLRLTMRDGRVSIAAKDVTVRQILTEWARVGQTRIVNVERIPGGAVTLELVNVTETQALEVLLRSLSGYIAAPRAVVAANLSAYDRIIIMPTLADARPAVSASASPSSAASYSPAYSPPPPPVFQQAQPVPEPVEDDQSEEPPAPIVAVSPDMNRSPGVNITQGLEVYRVPAGYRPRSPVTNASSPFGGVAVPGTVAPGQPEEPGQAQPPGAPGQPVRRPGGR